MEKTEPAPPPPLPTLEEAKALGLPDKMLADLAAAREAEAALVNRIRKRRAKRRELPSIKVNVGGPRHKLSVEQRGVRRVKNHLKATKRSQRLTGASGGVSVWRARAKEARKRKRAWKDGPPLAPPLKKLWED